MIFRRLLLSRKIVTLTILILVGLIMLYYSKRSDAVAEHRKGKAVEVTSKRTKNVISEIPPAPTHVDVCPVMEVNKADIETDKVFPSLNFEPEWMDVREYWNDKFDRRYKMRRKEVWPKLPLQVFIIPHSHNDPGWLQTYEGYFHASTNKIINNIVDKLTKYKSMTFIWTEMAYLWKWWENAHEARKQNLKKLVEEGRFEIPTGGWVMTDEANVHIYSMVDQMIEGHQWLQQTLDYQPKSSWSVDPFGHGGTFPYVLKESGIDGMMIMRIHYAWKEWFAKHQKGDFLWSQAWDKEGKHSILCHNFPYDIYSIKGSCGPHAQKCLEFNYRKIPGEYSEYTARLTPVHTGNVKERAELLLELYGKTGSLFPHNVVLVPLGDDFYYSHEEEFDHQYANYRQLMDHVNSHPEYHANIQFGTMADYFKAVRDRMSNFTTLHGDFFVYSDIFSEGRPAYWSGYYATRPYWKKLTREVESSLRAAEILFTLAYNQGRQAGNSEVINRFSRLYEALTTARRHQSLFQHHDAITGTSKSYVMHDYGIKLFEALKFTQKIHKDAIQYLMHKDHDIFVNNFLEDDFERNNYHNLPKPVTMAIQDSDYSIFVFNPLSHDRVDVMSFFVEDPNVCIYQGDNSDHTIPYQINPTWDTSESFRLDMHFVEVVFTTSLPALSITKFRVVKCRPDRSHFEKTLVYCKRCPSSNKSEVFDVDPMPTGSVQLENSQMSLIFDEDLLTLTQVTNKGTGRTENIQLLFSAYPTMQFRSGAYLFKTDPHQPENVDLFGPKTMVDAVIVSGPVFSELTLIYESGESKADLGSFIHTVRLYHVPGPMSQGIHIENSFGFGDSENHRDYDLFMRFKTGIKSDSGGSQNGFFTDQNGFQMQKRTKVSGIGIEGNYFPITSMTYIEDDETRLSLAVDHATGAASWEEGWLEVMVDRRSTYDDSRGMGEGILESMETQHRYWLMFEPKLRSSVDEKPNPPVVSVPSQVSVLLSRQLNYPTHHYISHEPSNSFEDQTKLIGRPLPCDLHIMNLRTLGDTNHEDANVPTKEALFILHKQTGDCSLSSNLECASEADNLDIEFGTLRVEKVTETSLTGNAKKGKETAFKELRMEPMTLKSLKVKF